LGKIPVIVVRSAMTLVVVAVEVPGCCSWAARCSSVAYRLAAGRSQRARRGHSVSSLGRDAHDVIWTRSWDGQRSRSRRGAAATARRARPLISILPRSCLGIDADAAAGRAPPRRRLSGRACSRGRQRK
jgi:hypothetical protein